MLRILLASLVLASLAAAAHTQELRGMDRLKAVHCGNPHNPCPPPPPPSPASPSISFSPAQPSIVDNASPGTVVSHIEVTMSDGSTFGGSLGFGPPYYNDSGLFAIFGKDVIVAQPLPAGNSTQNITVTATQT